MEQSKILSSQDFVFKVNFTDKHRHSISASDLANIILDLNKITNEIRREYPEVPHAELYFKPIKEGSVELIFQIVSDCASEIIKTIDWATDSEQKRWVLGSIGTGVLGVIALYADTKYKDDKLQFEKDKNNEELSTVFDKNGVPYVIPTRALNSTINSKTLEPTVQNLYGTLDRDIDIESVEFQEIVNHTPKYLGSIPKTEFALLKKATTKETQDDIKYEHFSEQELTAAGVSYYGKSAWKMIWNGIQHNFTINKDILESMQELRIGKRDKIIVDITIEKKLNIELNVYENKKYIINYFHKEILFEEPKLPFD